MTLELLVDVLIALIGQTPAIVGLIEKLRGEGRTALTDDEVASLKVAAPLAHQLLQAAAGQAGCVTCTAVVTKP